MDIAVDNVRYRAVSHNLSQTVRDRRWLHGGFAFFFAFLLPILCWGDLGDPAHPHQGAHFVFAEPQIEHPVQTGHHAGTVHDHRDQGAEPEGETSSRSLPTTILAQLLVVVAWQANQFALNGGRVTAAYLPFLFLAAPQLPVPTPPPRLCRKFYKMLPTIQLYYNKIRHKEMNNG